MRRLRQTALLLPLLWLAASCGGDDTPAPFILQINSADVILNAVDRVEIIIRPSDLDRRFQMVPDMSHEGGTVFTRVSGAGEFVITMERDYVEANATTGTTGTTFTLELPVASSEEPDDPSIGDPTMEVNLIRGTERIATGQRFLVWPFPPGERAIVTVSCNRPEFDRQCTNNDPLPSSDAGTPPADGG